jgi:hypothetical protein
VAKVVLLFVKVSAVVPNIVLVLEESFAMGGVVLDFLNRTT